jgi:hypothetical protein
MHAAPKKPSQAECAMAKANVPTAATNSKQNATLGAK